MPIPWLVEYHIYQFLKQVKLAPLYLSSTLPLLMMQITPEPWKSSRFRLYRVYAFLGTTAVEASRFVCTTSNERNRSVRVTP